MKRKQNPTSYRELRRLVEQLRIVESMDPKTWPPVHQKVFEQIGNIGDQDFANYYTDNRSEHPWKAFTKKRAECLAHRARTLLGRKANEEDWRHALEGELLLRFRAEVQCPTCRAKIWKADSEAFIDPSADINNLQKRRKTRVFCHCQPYPYDNMSYETGGNQLFDDRLEHVIVHDPEVNDKLQLPDKEPDRVVGLRQTKAFEKIFNEISEELENDEFVSSLTPFNDTIQPLLLPFLVLEAKSKRSGDGFEKILVQTALPIRALLRLQEGARVRASGDLSNTAPLVWYFANRGDTWRVYGCYVTNDTTEKYEIAQLWEGNVEYEDASLQLLLIVDYIFDWAREIYRPSILRLLKSAARGIGFDQVSLTNDSDISSSRQLIASWIPKPPTISTTLGIIEENTNDLDHGSISSISRGEAVYDMHVTRSTKSRFDLRCSLLEMNWPEEYRRYFRVVRNIWETKYEKYILRRDIDAQQIDNQKARVEYLCSQARFMQNHPMSEASWIRVYNDVFRIFDQEVVCHRCKNEKWRSDYKAEPLDEEHKARLRTERRSRNECQCHLGVESVARTNDHRDDDRCETRIFEIDFHPTIIYYPNDYQTSHRVISSPDTVIGLKMTDEYEELAKSCLQNLIHCRVGRMSMLYPFIIIESSSSSFRSMENRITFSLQHLLGIQSAFQEASHNDLDPLVWIFMFLKDACRVYAGIIDDSNLRIFDLWNGKVSSHDGALQLFQIVDFIWTWARDVCRLQLRSCLRAGNINPGSN